MVTRNAAESIRRMRGRRCQVLQSSRLNPIQAVTPARAAKRHMGDEAGAEPEERAEKRRVQQVREARGGSAANRGDAARGNADA